MQTFVAFLLGKVVLSCVLVGYWYMLIDHIKENKSRRGKMTVEDLRKRGFKIRVHHHRRVTGKVVNPLGGKTVVEITTPDGTTLVGVSRCSRKENFNKRLGVRIALGRALARRKATKV